MIEYLTLAASSSIAPASKWTDLEVETINSADFRTLSDGVVAMLASTIKCTLTIKCNHSIRATHFLGYSFDDLYLKEILTPAQLFL